MPSCREVDSLVTPYIDGEATAAERAVVDAHLMSCPPCRHRAAVEAAARETLRGRLCRPCAPDQLRERCLAAAGRTARRSLRSLAIAAALILIVGGVLTYSLTRLSPTVLAAQLTLDHVKCFAVDRPVTPVDARVSEEAFARDHGWQIRLPRISTAGLQLVGVRQCFCAEGGATAHAMYRFQGRPVSLYILPDVDRDKASAGVFGHDALIWSNQGNTYVLLGKESDAALQQLAADLNQGL
jgi:anti-sigma factor RsiW